MSISESTPEGNSVISSFLGTTNSMKSEIDLETERILSGLSNGPVWKLRNGAEELTMYLRTFLKLGEILQKTGFGHWNSSACRTPSPISDTGVEDVKYQALQVEKPFSSQSSIDCKPCHSTTNISWGQQQSLAWNHSNNEPYVERIFYCGLCKTSCCARKIWLEHLESSGHIKKVAKPPKSVSVACKICFSVIISDRTSAIEYMKSHFNRVHKLQADSESDMFSVDLHVKPELQDTIAEFKAWKGSTEKWMLFCDLCNTCTVTDTTWRKHVYSETHSDVPKEAYAVVCKICQSVVVAELRSASQLMKEHLMEGHNVEKFETQSTLYYVHVNERLTDVLSHGMTNLFARISAIPGSQYCHFCDSTFFSVMSHNQSYGHCAVSRGNDFMTECNICHLSVIGEHNIAIEHITYHLAATHMMPFEKSVMLFSGSFCHTPTLQTAIDSKAANFPDFLAQYQSFARFKSHWTLKEKNPSRRIPSCLCLICFDRFESKRAFQKHILTHVPASKSRFFKVFVCSNCNCSLFGTEAEVTICFRDDSHKNLDKTCASTKK